MILCTSSKKGCFASVGAADHNYLRNKRGSHRALVDHRLKINKTVFGSKKIEENTSVF